MARKKQDKPSGERTSTGSPAWIRASGIGLEFAGAVAGFTLIGYFVDRHYESGPWGVLGGAVLGLTGGMYNMVRASLAAMRDATAKPDATAKRDAPVKPDHPDEKPQSSGPGEGDAGNGDARGSLD